MMNYIKARLVDDWHWVVNHSWSLRLIVLAFVLSVAETIMPYFTSATHPVLYTVTMGLITGGAFVARLMAQSKPDA